MSGKKKILVVDDDVDVLEQISLVLSGFGYEVITSNSEIEAEDILSRVKPDLAIIDVMMENQDSGFVLSHQIKRLYPKTPVIILTSVTAATGIDFPARSDECRMWINVDAFIDKPVRPEYLETEVRRLVN